MRIQSRTEEHLNVFTHVIGAVLGISGLILLIIFESHKTSWSLFSVLVYGISTIVLFSASSLYHSAKNETRKHYFRIVDHISIYLLIAGTYTPFTLITLKGWVGWNLFSVSWGMALTGVILKLIYNSYKYGSFVSCILSVYHM